MIIINYTQNKMNIIFITAVKWIGCMTSVFLSVTV